MKKDFLWMLGILIVMTGISVQAQDISVNRDSVTTNGSVNQVVVVNPTPPSPQVRSARNIHRYPTVVNNYYYEDPNSSECGHVGHGPIDTPRYYPDAPPVQDNFNYQDIWLIVLSLLLVLGLGIFFGYLIWGKNTTSSPTTICLHGGQSSSSSSSSSCCGHQTSSLGKAPTPAPSSAPVATTVAPAPPVATAVEQEKKTEEKKN